MTPLKQKGKPLAPIRLTRDNQKIIFSYLSISVTCIFFHGFLLTNDGTIWDSWYVVNQLKTHRFPVLHDFFASVGIPFYFWLYRPFAFLPDIVAGFMWATFLCLLLQGILTFHLAMKLARLSRGEALALALLAQAMPIFTGAQDFIMFFFIFTHTLFLCSALLALRIQEETGWTRWLPRVLALGGFYLSFSNAALLVFYGGFYLLFFFRYRHLHDLEFIPAIRRFLFCYPDFFLLPPITWALRSLLTPQYGWYKYYNSPLNNIKRLCPNLWSFFQNVLPYHFRNTMTWFAEHTILTILLTISIVSWSLLAPKSRKTKLSNLPAWQFILFGALTLFLAIFPYAAAGKDFPPLPLGAASHHCILVGLPIAIILLGGLRLIFRSRSRESRMMLPVIAIAVVVLGSQIIPVYVAERSEWIYSRAVLHNAVRNEVVQSSSVILLQGYSVAAQAIYGMYGFATAFGEMTRFCTPDIPDNREYYTPTEIELRIELHTFPPGEFKRINPTGRQILLQAKRNQPEASPWEIVSQYLKLKYFHPNEDMDEFLTSLVTLETAVLKPATALITEPAPPDSWTESSDAKEGGFTNGSGLQMLRLSPDLWASKFETTQSQYQSLMETNPSLFQDPFRPVECVSWNDAMEFCRRLTERESAAGRLPPGFIYRLPTEQEFDEMTDQTPLENAVTSFKQARWHTEPAGSLPPNRFGLHDTFGNVWEWCLDWKDADKRYKVAKGGSWVDTGLTLNAYTGSREGMLPYIAYGTERLFGPTRWDYPDQGFWDRGFRCVLAHPSRETK